MLQQYNMPEHVAGIKEIQEIIRAYHVILGEVDEDLAQLQNNILIMKSDEAGIARREKIVNIVPKDVKTLEERKYELLVKWYDSPPYTEKNLRKRMDRLCGKGQYVMEICKRGKTLSVLLELTSKNNLEAIKSMLEEIVPLNVIIDVGLRYNQYKTLKRFAYGELKTFTYMELRNEVLS